MSLPYQISAEEQVHWFEYITDRWGLPDAFFDSYVLCQRNVKTLNIVNADSLPMVDPVPKSVGIPFLRVNSAVPKPTTGAMLWMGPSATRNIVMLDRDQVDRYLRRESFAVTKAQCIEAEVGYVVVRCGQMTVSIGYLKDGILNNVHPKAWSIASGVSAFQV